MAPALPSLFRMPFSAATVSPDCELWASSTITAKRLPAVSSASPSPFFSSVRIAWLMNGNFWMVEMMIGVPPASARASCCVSSVIFSTTPVLCSNW